MRPTKSVQLEDLHFSFLFLIKNHTLEKSNGENPLIHTTLNAQRDQAT